MKTNLTPKARLRLILFVLLVYLLAACAGPEPPELAGTSWQLTKIDQGNGSILEPRPAASFSLNFNSQRLSGLAACNSYSVPYQLLGSRLQLGAVEQTAQDCGAESEKIIRQFFTVLGSDPEYSLADGQLVLANSQVRLEFAAQQDPTGDESAVLNALLRQWAQPQETLLLIDMTAYNRPGASLPETLAAVRAEFNRFEASDPAAAPSPALFDDFSERNSTPVILSDWFEPDWEVEYLPPELLPVLQADNFQTIQSDNPDSSGVFVLSRPGFNPAGDQALVYLALLRPDDASGYYTWMILHDGQWQSALSFRLGQ